MSIRDIIFREIITNLLVHREYSNAYPSKLIIGLDEVFTENASKPHGYGIINPESFSPFPKNPIIAGIFKEIGLIDELGSGVRNLFKYSKIYFGNDPKLVEGDIFKLSIIKKSSQDSLPQLVEENALEFSIDTSEPELNIDITQQADNRTVLLKGFCKIPRTRQEMQEFLQIGDREYFRTSILKPLIEQGILKLCIPEKPRSPKQKYYS